MAINEKDIGSSQQQAQGQSTMGSAFAAAGIGGAQRQSDFAATLAGIGGGFVAPGVGGEYYTKMREMIVSIGKDLMNDAVDAQIYGLNRQEHDNLRFSVLILALRIKTMPGVVAYHSLILEATGEKLKPEIRNIDNQQVRINRVTGDAYDRILETMAMQVIQSNYTNDEVVPAAATVIPASVTPESRATVEAVVRNAAMACVSQVMSVKNAFQSLNLSTMPRDARLVIDMATSNTNVYDDVGNPQRASVQLTMSIQRTQRQQNDLSIINSPDSMTRICDLVGFVNPIWAPLNQMNAFGFQNPMMQQQMIPQGKLAAQFVITGVRTPYATSPAAVLLAMSSFLLMCDNNNWIQALIPKSGRRDGALDITDIGALNIICNVANETDKGSFGSVVDVAGMEGNLSKLNQYITTLFRPGQIVAIDCPEVQPQSWYLNLFAAAAMGNMDAINAIIRAANELTDNRFSQYFNGNSIFATHTRVPLGYYMSGNEKRDIRDIDLTAICNLFKSNPEMIHEYSATFCDRPGAGPLTNLAKREGFIFHALKEQCEITGYALRCTFSQEFINAFSRAIADMNLATVINTPLNADQLRNGVPTPDFVAAALVSGTNTFTNMGSFSGRGMPYNTTHFNGNYR